MEVGKPASFLFGKERFEENSESLFTLALMVFMMVPEDIV
jgi:hypothetical protein